MSPGRLHWVAWPLQLTGQGFKCLAATDSYRAKELLDRQPFDAMVADIAMPGADGLDLLAYARRVAPNCKVILITGFSNRDRLAQALLLGAYDYLEKPLDRRRGDPMVRGEPRQADPPRQSGLGCGKRGAVSDGARIVRNVLSAKWLLVRSGSRGPGEKKIC